MSDELRSPSGFVSRSHRAIAPFVLSRPSTVEGVVARLEAGAHAHAGGIDLVERLQRGMFVAEVVDLASVAGLDTIDVVGDRLRIGAGVTHARLEADPLICDRRPDLAAAWRTVANVRIRRTGTVGGNLMALDKNYDAAPILAAAGAALIFAGDGADTSCSVADRDRPGLLVAIDVPLDGRLVFDRSLKPVASVAVGNDTIAVGCAHRDVVAGARPTGSPGEAAASFVASMPEPLHDADASATYRRRLIEVQVRRCLEAFS
jgi:aerobic carbon-monoxide dehydrogenase medium subunit